MTSLFKNIVLKRSVSIFTVFIFVFRSGLASALEMSLISPEAMVQPSGAYVPMLLKGLTVHPENPLMFDFVLDHGDDASNESVQAEGRKLINYFMTAVTIPQGDFWVNLSPHEHDRIIPDAMNKTELGSTLLTQDYLLKQLTASLLHPNSETGKRFWDEVYAKSYKLFGTTDIPIDTFNKVWIVPGQARVYEHGQTVYVVDTRLDVMLDSDYLAQQKAAELKLLSPVPGTPLLSDPGKQIMRDVVLPELRREVNEGAHFASLRQVVYSLVLAKWYKQNFKKGILNKVYADQSKIRGIDLNNPRNKEQIFQQYVAAYTKGVFNFIREENDVFTGENIPRKYFSGGIVDSGMALVPVDEAVLYAQKLGKQEKLSVILQPVLSDNAMNDNEDIMDKLSEIRSRVETVFLKSVGSRPYNKNVMTDTIKNLYAQGGGAPDDVAVELLMVSEMLLDYFHFFVDSKLQSKEVNQLFINDILQQIDKEVLRPLIERNHALAKLFPQASHWLAFIMLPNYNTHIDLFRHRLRAVAEYSSEASAILLMVLASRVRQGRQGFKRVSFLNQYVPLLSSRMMKELENFFLHQNYAEARQMSTALINGLLLPVQKKSDYFQAHAFMERVWHNQGVDSKSIIREIFERYPELTDEAHLKLKLMGEYPSGNDIAFIKRLTTGPGMDGMSFYDLLADTSKVPIDVSSLLDKKNDWLIVDFELKHIIEYAKYFPKKDLEEIFDLWTLGWDYRQRLINYARQQGFYGFVLVGGTEQPFPGYDQFALSAGNRKVPFDIKEVYEFGIKENVLQHAGGTGIYLWRQNNDAYEFLMLDYGRGLRDREGNVIADPGRIFSQGVTFRKGAKGPGKDVYISGKGIGANRLANEMTLVRLISVTKDKEVRIVERTVPGRMLGEEIPSKFISHRLSDLGYQYRHATGVIVHGLIGLSQKGRSSRFSPVGNSTVMSFFSQPDSEALMPSHYSQSIAPVLSRSFIEQIPVEINFSEVIDQQWLTYKSVVQNAPIPQTPYFIFYDETRFNINDIKAIEKDDYGKKEYMEVGKDGSIWDIMNKLGIGAMDEVTIYYNSYEQIEKDSLVSGIVAQLPNRNNSGTVIVTGSDGKQIIMGPEQIREVKVVDAMKFNDHSDNSMTQQEQRERIRQKQADLVRYAQSLAARFPEYKWLAWKNAALVSWGEIVRDPGNREQDGPEGYTTVEYGSLENRWNYWANQLDVRRAFLDMIAEALISINEEPLGERLKKAHSYLILGAGGTSFYKPPSSKGILSADVDVNYLKGVAVTMRMSVSDVERFKTGLLHLVSEMKEQRIDKSVLVPILGSLYLTMMWQGEEENFRTDNLNFDFGNHSFVLNFINTILRLSSIKEIRNGYFDYYFLEHSSMVSSRQEAVGYVQKTLLDLVIEANSDMGRSINAGNAGTYDRSEDSNRQFMNKNDPKTDTGGIDLSPDKMDLQVQSDGQGVQFNSDPAMIRRLQNAFGFVPVIVDIQPMTLPVFLGLSK